MNETAAETPWTLRRRVLFRFAALYFFFYAFPFPPGYLPGTDTVGELLSDLWQPIVPWTGEHLLSLAEPIVIQRTGIFDGPERVAVRRMDGSVPWLTVAGG